MKTPLVSIIIPCRNEEQFIAACLNSLISQDYPKDKIEILVVDGVSDDNTRKIVTSYRTQFANIRLLTNPKKTTPISMNIGIRNAKGDVLTKTDAHTLYPEDYISKCVRYLEKYKADAVGGIAKPFPGSFTLTAKAIALVLSSHFGSRSSFRIGANKPILSDTAFGTSYRKGVFKQIGLFNENLTRSQDMDFHLRLTRAGGKLLLAPDIELIYYPYSTFKRFLRHNVGDGVWAILPLKFGASLFRFRHLLPFLFVITILIAALLSLLVKNLIWLPIIILLIYTLTSLYFSTEIAVKERRLTLIPFLMITFALRHFGYGIGSLIGVVKLILPQKPQILLRPGKASPSFKRLRKLSRRGKQPTKTDKWS